MPAAGSFAEPRPMPLEASEVESQEQLEAELLPPEE